MADVVAVWQALGLPVVMIVGYADTEMMVPGGLLDVMACCAATLGSKSAMNPA